MSVVWGTKTEGRDVRELVWGLMDRMGAPALLTPGAWVVVKPNLAMNRADKAHASNTDPLVLDAVLAYLDRFEVRTVVGESDGTRFKAEECAEVTGFWPVIEKYAKAEWMNFSEHETADVPIPALRDNGFGLPKTVMEADLVIDLPVLKTHALTVFTGAVKNLWGLVTRYDRILIHRHLDPALADICALVKPRINLMDAMLCMEGRGPVNGTPVRLNMLLASADPVALDATAMRLVGLDPKTARHLCLAERAGAGVLREDGIRVEPVGCSVDDLRARVTPAYLDSPTAWMNHLTRYPFFTYKILLNDGVFQMGKRAVNALRRAKIIKST